MCLYLKYIFKFRFFLVRSILSFRDSRIGWKICVLWQGGPEMRGFRGDDARWFDSGFYSLRRILTSAILSVEEELEGGGEDGRHRAHKVHSLCSLY